MTATTQTEPTRSIPSPARQSRPLYLKAVPTPLWNKLHVEAIECGVSLQDYLIALLLTRDSPADTQGSSLTQTNPTWDVLHSRSKVLS